MNDVLEGPWERPTHFTDDLVVATRRILSIKPGIISTEELSDAIVQLYRRARTGPGACVARLLYESRYARDRVLDTLETLFDAYNGETGYLHTALEAVNRAPPSRERTIAMGRIVGQLDAVGF